MATIQSQGPLPPGWRWVPLGEACEQDRRIVEPSSGVAAALPYLSLEHVECNSGRILREPSETVQDEGKSTTFAFDSRHVLYGKLRPYLNKVALPGFSGRCTTEIIPLLPTEGTDRNYLAWLLRRNETVNAAMRQRTGSRMPRADMDDLLSLEIPLPPPEEQKRIATILSDQMVAVERARAAAEAQLAAAKALPAAYLRAVFSSPDAQQWPRKPLRDLCGSDGQYGTSEKADSSGVGLPVLRMCNILDGRIFWDDLKFIQLPNVDEEKYRLVKGDVLFNRTNSAELVGKTAVYDGSHDAVFASYLIRFRIEPTAADSKFVCSYINSEYGRRFIEQNMARAIGQVNISASTMHRMPIPLPTLINQQRIAAMVNDQMASAERARKAIEEELDAINKLPAALLRRAFGGEL
jgi:type I restriction enzyme S subunit